MIFTNERGKYRQAFFLAWQKHIKRLPIDGVEAQLIDIILIHPAYQTLLENEENIENLEFSLDENPYLHMSLHLAIREQIHIDRPVGITEVYQNLLIKLSSAHEVEHHMMDCLADFLWQSQRNNIPPNEIEYMQELRRI